MQIKITVPAIGESITEATVATLLAAQGSVVTEGQEILELETDKVNQALYAPQAGSVRFLVAVGDTVKPGQVVAELDTDVSNPPKVESRETSAEPPVSKPVPLDKPSPPSPVSESAGRKKMSVLRKTIAAKLVEAKNKTAMLTTFNEVDMSEVIAVRLREKERFSTTYGVKLGLMSFFLKATAKALDAYPVIRSFVEGEEIVTPEAIDIGVAVSTDRGLVVPVVRNCRGISFERAETEIAAYAQKARDGKIGIDDLKGGCFTLTNGGVFGSLLSTPILNPPQSAVLGMHAVVKRPVAVDDQPVIRPMMYLALSYDHRIIDGKEAVLFLVYLKELLEHVDSLTSEEEFFQKK